MTLLLAFSMRRPILLILSHMVDDQSADLKLRCLFDLNDPRYACRLTGFMPLHVAVANGLTDVSKHAAAESEG